ncbi:MAG: Hsp70 family protein [Verrucomicrobia bacterium]|nr:Hsp70 family protein [Verrucomicrobiota bacterium]
MSDFIGIDLGTSNCAIARVGDTGHPENLPITQAITGSSEGEKSLLPSAIYLPAEGEFPESSTRQILGLFARERGALQPDRLIVSAKSWLCHPHADRRGPILPWGSTTVDRKLSPLEASSDLLAHLIASLKNSHPHLAATHPVITVPASFDEVARGLTLEAAQLAGIPEATLLEEPQAAFYAWLENQGADWRKQVQSGDLLLVCDVGGGTADFSLIAVTGKDGNLALERVAVGEHLLLGGDNMDLALAHDVSEKLAATGSVLDDWQFLALVQSVRSAKESLLSDSSLKEVPIAIPARSSRLIASTLSTTLTREQVDQIVLDGFLPLVTADEMPALRRAGGLRESGLPYATDAAISKHLARFLTRAKANIASSPQLLDSVGGSTKIDSAPLLIPDAVLFNGGVFNASPLRARVLDQLSRWANRPIRELEGARPDHAVALGAAVYARLRATGQGLRIKSGTARSYYIGMESTGMAVPGRRPVTKALCVAPQGMEEGTSHEISDQEFLLYTGETSDFRFFQSEVRAGDQPGQILPDAAELEESAKLQIEIPPPAGHQPGEEIPVHLQARITELGHLELHFLHKPTGDRWKLEFNVRMQ